MEGDMAGTRAAGDSDEQDPDDFERLGTPTSSLSSLLSSSWPGSSSAASYFRGFEDLFFRDVRNTLKSGAGVHPKHFRDVAWAYLLALLPESISEWVGAILERRHAYSALVLKHAADERHDATAARNVVKNNPLSQDADSPWNIYFQDRELKKEIKQDVDRTCPGNTYFKTKSVQESMITMLFVYAKEFPQMSYKQGMHELLAALLMLHFDCCQEFKKVPQLSGAELEKHRRNHEVLSVVYDLHFLEHDVYFLFEKIMENMWDWYYVPKDLFQRKLGQPVRHISVPLTEQRPFARSQPGLLLGNAAIRLQSMWDNILRLQDQELYEHLQNMQVIPTTFGINWTKLLFSRQFQNYLVIWDSIIATHFSLVDYIIVAMVIAIRSLLLEGDANRCNTLLVSQYPRCVDMRFVISLALHIQDPLSEPRPRRASMQFSLPRMSSATGQSPFASPRLPKRAVATKGDTARSKTLFGFSGRAGSATPRRKTVQERKMVDLSGPRRDAMTAAASDVDVGEEALADDVTDVIENGFELLRDEQSQTLRLSEWCSVLDRSVESLRMSLALHAPALLQMEQVCAALADIAHVTEQMTKRRDETALDALELSEIENVVFADAGDIFPSFYQETSVPTTFARAVHK